MKSRDRFLAACRKEPVDRPPVWVMRQAGRHLPEYRALKADHTFVELVQTPELAAEVTLQPLRRYPMDAAIIFSDILVIPEALGQPYTFPDGGGIEMAYRIEGASDLPRLDASGVSERLDYVAGTIREVRKAVGDRAVIGFAGAPWTLATYMVEGGSSREYRRAKELFHLDRATFDALLEKITVATIDYLRLQIEAGVDAVQIFDSWGGALGPDMFWEASGIWMTEIVKALPDEVPVIVFSKGAHNQTDALRAVGADVLGFDWTVKLDVMRSTFGTAVQGNLDPALMSTTPEIVRNAANELLDRMGSEPGHIMNLGHGISPEARIDCMEALAETVVARS